MSEETTQTQEQAPVVDLRAERNKRKLQAQKIVEKHLTTGKQLTKNEVLTILTEMCEIVETIERELQKTFMRLQAAEFQSRTVSAMGVTLHKLLQEKGVFTEEEFKNAWTKFVEEPIKKAEEEARAAQAKQAQEAIEQVKKDSLEAAQTLEQVETTPEVPAESIVG